MTAKPGATHTREVMNGHDRAIIKEEEISVHVARSVRVRHAVLEVMSNSVDCSIGGMRIGGMQRWR